MHIDHAFQLPEIIVDTIKNFPEEDIYIIDHLNGFSKTLDNDTLDLLVDVKCPNPIYLQYVITPELKSRYNSININFSAELQNSINFTKHSTYNIHPELDYKNFICSFNGTPHVSRKLLVAILEKFKWFNAHYCSKNFSYDSAVIDGHLHDYLSTDRDLIYNKFFYNSETFNQAIHTFGHVRFEHDKNIYNLENKLTESFLHIVSETMATSYYPFVTEKFLYSVCTRGLFLAYAQPGWHQHLEKYYGFKRYTKLFDYRFDSIENPVERLVELISMISKFSVLSKDDWKDLYLTELDTIEYNYNHYFSQGYLKTLSQYE